MTNGARQRLAELDEDKRVSGLLEYFRRTGRNEKLSRCNVCGYTCKTENVPEKVVASGRRERWEDSTPDTKETTCPDCGAAESFEEIA